MTDMKKLLELSLLELLRLVYSKDYPCHGEPVTNKRRSQVVRGTVKSELARRIFAVSTQFSKEAYEMSLQWARVESEEGHRMQKLLKKAEDTLNSLQNLFWISVAVEFPAVFANRSAVLCAGWTLVTDDVEWIPKPMFKAGDPVATLARDIGAILTGKLLVGMDIQSLPVRAHNEPSLGVVTNSVTRSLLGLFRQVGDRGRAFMAIPGRPKNSADLQPWLSTKSQEELETLMEQTQFYRHLLHLLRAVYMESVWETVPQSSGKEITFRKGWEVVEEEDDTSLVLELPGGLLAIPVNSPLGRHLEELQALKNN